jgi:hypothetical protein
MFFLQHCFGMAVPVDRLEFSSYLEVQDFEVKSRAQDPKLCTVAVIHLLLPDTASR